MKEICVVIDCSGSMACLAKGDIIQSVCRNLFLHENFEFKFYAWGKDIREIAYTAEGLSFVPGGKNSFSTLMEFIRGKLTPSADILLMTDGFVDEDAMAFSAFVRDSKQLTFRLMGIGADFSKVMALRLFPKNYTAIETDINRCIFSARETEAVLESFYEE